MNTKAIQIIPILAISLVIALSSAYVSYYNVASADFLSSDLGFEAFDQEYLLAASQSELKGPPSIGFFSGFQPGTYLFELPSYLFSQISSPDHKTFVLRC